VKRRVLATALLASSVASASPSAKLTYVRGAGAEACPDEAALRKAVAARLGYDPFFPTAPQTIVAEIRAQAPSGFHGEVQIVDAAGIVRGKRVLASASTDCAEMVRTLALGISIAIDDLDAIAPPPPPPEPPPAATSAPEDPAPPPPPPVDRDRAPTPVLPAPTPGPSFVVALGGHGSFGLAPASAVGASVGVGVAWRSLSIALEGAGELPASAPTDGGGRVRSSILVGSLVPCFRARVAFGCAVGSLGSFHGAGIDIASPHASSALLALVGARGGAELAINDTFGVAPHADLLVPLLRHAIEIDGRTVFTLPPVAAALGIDFVAHISSWIGP
jgi:hypothetical protein